MDTPPNIYSVLIIAVQGVIGLTTLVVTYLLSRKSDKQDSKLDTIHILVNGNLAAEKAKTAQLETQVRDLGHEPVTNRQEPS